MAAAEPCNTMLQSHAAAFDAWHRSTVSSSKRSSPIFVHSAFVAAVKAGPQSTQKWLSRATRKHQPSLRVETQADAERVREFRARVASLDGRCDAASEQSAAREVERLRVMYRQQLCNGNERLLAQSPSADLDTVWLFVTPMLASRYRGIIDEQIPFSS